MNELFRIDDTLTNKISYYHLLLLMASLPFDMFYSHLILISFSIHSLIHLNKNSIRSIFTLKTLVLQSVFFLTLICITYTVDTKPAFTELGRRVIIFIVPILFCINPLDLKKYRPNLMLFFSLVCTAVILYLYVNALITIRYYKLPVSMLFSSFFANHNFSEPINMHATFFSMQVALSLVFLLSLLIKEKALRNKLVYLCCCLLLTGGIIQLSSKSVCVALLIVINIIVPFTLLKGIKRRRFVLAAALLSLLAFTGILLSNTFRERYITELATDLSPAKPNDVLDSRLARWKVIVKLIESSPLQGHGTGSELPLLHEKFFNSKLYNSFLNNLNAHNQYLSFLIKSGIIGLIIYIAVLAFGLKLSFQNRDLLFITFLLIITTVSFSENLLDVDKGIFYYAFFYAFFIFSTQVPKLNSKSLKSL
ncbi:O-antigen ligase family protein [Mucilaginibacter xinganensis]|nr:O-antigen ligase family protein [Mucilaginibacter xinganensis]